MSAYIVADIGGTNARFASIKNLLDHPYKLEQIEILPTSDHQTFSDALRHYLEITGQAAPKAMCAAIAGPVEGDTVRMTNLSWEFSCSDVSRELGMGEFIVMNDFAAVAAACSRLEEDDLANLKPGIKHPDAPKAVFGPGTGLGVAGLVPYGNQWRPVPAEGGHVNLAPTTAFECEVLKAALQKQLHVSAETFLCGPGLVNLYQAICDVQNETPQALKPSDITQNALDGSDAHCVTTLSTFCSLLGAFAGNVALTYGAKGGVYIAGGVLPRFIDFVRKSAFIEKFGSKGVMSPYLNDISIDVITHSETAFVGAAAWLEQHLSGR